MGLSPNTLKLPVWAQGPALWLHLLSSGDKFQDTPHDLSKMAETYSLEPHRPTALDLMPVLVGFCSQPPGRQ
jgi:hypothetical protein